MHPAALSKIYLVSKNQINKWYICSGSWFFPDFFRLYIFGKYWFGVWSIHLIMPNSISQEPSYAKCFSRLFVFSAQFVSSLFPHPSPGLSSLRNNFCSRPLLHTCYLSQTPLNSSSPSAFPQRQNFFPAGFSHSLFNYMAREQADKHGEWIRHECIS